MLLFHHLLNSLALLTTVLAVPTKSGYADPYSTRTSNTDDNSTDAFIELQWDHTLYCYDTSRRPLLLRPEECHSIAYNTGSRLAPDSASERLADGASRLSSLWILYQ